MKKSTSGERVGSYVWRRDTAVRLRVKILACGDRAKAQTAATHQDNNVHWSAFKRTLSLLRLLSKSEFRFLSHREDCFLYSCLRRDTQAFFSCRFSGNGLRLHCRDSDGRGAAELAHCWTGYIISLVAKTVCSNVYTAPQINFSYQCTASRRVKTRIVYTGFSEWICCCQSLVHFRIFAVRQAWIICQ